MLARAHSQSPSAEAIPAFLSGGKDIDEALVAYAQGYAEIILEDYHALKAAADSGQVPVTYGV